MQSVLFFRLSLVVLVLGSGAEDVSIKTGEYVVDLKTERFLSSGWEMWAYTGLIPKLGDSVLRQIVKNLGPGTVRVGGITADFIFYDTAKKQSSKEGTRDPFLEMKRDVSQFWPDYEEDLSMEGFHALVDFAAQADLDLLFTLNELHGRNCHVNGSHCTGNWDTSNVKAFFTYLKDNNVGPIYGFELGNELTTYYKHITMDENIADYQTLSLIVNEVWPQPETRPPIYGPSIDACDSTVDQFMTGTKSFLTGFTYHSYPGQDGKNLKSQLVDIDWLKNNIIINDLHAHSALCIQTWKNIGQPVGMEIWVTETSSSYEGIEGVINGFYNSFWYLSSLGQYALTGVTRHSRWALHGGDAFTFINMSTPNITVTPDYWVAVLYKRLVGSKVLSVTGSFTNILAYAHCGKDNISSGSVVLLFINPSPTSIPLTISGLSSTLPRDEYFLTADSLSSYFPQLNNKELHIQPDGNLPDLSPVTVTSGGSPVLPKYSVGFIVFPTANAIACK